MIKFSVVLTPAPASQASEATSLLNNILVDLNPKTRAAYARVWPKKDVKIYIGNFQL